MQNFIAYLQSKNHSNTTQTAYLRYVTAFFKWTSKEATQITKKDILSYLEYLQTTKKQANITRRNSLIALHHYFTFLSLASPFGGGLEGAIPTTFLKIRGANKKKLYNIFTHEELTQLTDDYYHHFVRNYNDNHIPKNQRKQSFLSKERNYLMLSLLLNQGLTTRELQKINVEDLDLTKATVKITGAKKSNERNIPLNASQIGSLMHYTQNIRPQFFEFYNIESNQLFLALPEAGRTQTQSTDLMGVIKNLTKQVKTLESSFLNFKQIRASVITHWIKTTGLRKAQYFAGHKYISSTENYLPNDLQSLTEDITKFNPF